MSCRRFKNSLLDFADGTLPDERALKLRNHLETCEGCSRAVDQLAMSSSALSSLGTAAMPSDAAARVMSSLRASAQRGDRIRPTFRERTELIFSPRGIATAGAIGLLLIAAIVVGIVFSGGGTPTGTNKTVISSSANDMIPGGPLVMESSAKENSGAAQPIVPQGIATILPVAKVSKANYDANTLKSTFDSMPLKKDIAERYSMTHAISLGDMFKQKMADIMMSCGGDGPMLEAMITYVTGSEPVLLPYYAEKCEYCGQAAFVIGLAGPRRTAKSMKLTRTEVWVMNPDKFASNPDASLIYFMEEK